MLPNIVEYLYENKNKQSNRTCIHVYHVSSGCVYIYVCACVCVCARKCIYIYVCVCAYTIMHIHAHVHAWMYVCLICIYIYMGMQYIVVHPHVSVSSSPHPALSPPSSMRRAANGWGPKAPSPRRSRRPADVSPGSQGVAWGFIPSEIKICWGFIEVHKTSNIFELYIMIHYDNTVRDLIPQTLK